MRALASQVLNTIDVQTPRSDDRNAETPFVKALFMGMAVAVEEWQWLEPL